MWCSCCIRVHICVWRPEVDVRYFFFTLFFEMTLLTDHIIYYRIWIFTQFLLWLIKISLSGILWSFRIDRLGFTLGVIYSKNWEEPSSLFVLNFLCVCYVWAYIMNLELTDLTVPAGQKTPGIIRLVPTQAKISGLHHVLDLWTLILFHEKHFISSFPCHCTVFQNYRSFQVLVFRLCLDLS